MLVALFVRNGFQTAHGLGNTLKPTKVDLLPNWVFSVCMCVKGYPEKNRVRVSLTELSFRCKKRKYLENEKDILTESIIIRNFALIMLSFVFFVTKTSSVVAFSCQGSEWQSKSVDGRIF